MIPPKRRIAILVPWFLLILWSGTCGPTGCSPHGGPPEKITIGTNLNAMIGLIFITKTQGYDKDHNLEIILKGYQTGLESVRELKAGRLDLASCAEFALVEEIFAGGADLRCLATISSGEVDELIARRDQGVNRPGDLKGKAIGVPRKTSAEFFLGRFLTFNHISLGEVRVVDVNPFDLADTLAAGKVDAVLIWEPITHDIKKKLGNNTVAWPAQEGQQVYRLLLSREEVVKTKAAALEKLMRALAQAAEFAREQPAAARAIVSQWLKVPVTDLQAPKKYDLFLEQVLLLAMEDQARWMIENKLTDQTRVPNYLEYIDAEVLLKVTPQAVRIIIPKNKM
ncbi:MAG: ABC transporter substrate-binding protein [Syntrophobacterales bacterium]|jgi:NitT/TauT family transport system substrate-binding protein|nr:ABC transporter substrate-binding protein [Syntrophobacterales bacterium]